MSNEVDHEALARTIWDASGRFYNPNRVLVPAWEDQRLSASRQHARYVAEAIVQAGFRRTPAPDVRKVVEASREFADALDVELTEFGNARIHIYRLADALDAVSKELDMRRSESADFEKERDEAVERLEAAASAPQDITDAMIERGAKALWIADQDDDAWARSVVDDVFSPADDWPVECIELGHLASLVLAAALGVTK
ncbi:hypothetical protein [uncultured Microbacterium sp.]|uniref:hypothetical protein n=1 Tax=uncultured Microbacterium sp. TaxID=191216 RepID=UPI002615A04E|nr:hypothetical protein [uncultured Microbacterium sp.]